MSNHLEQIKSRILLSSFIAQTVILKSKGAGQYIGLCPFHSENTPSFTVSDTKKFYHCFGCGAHGDIFTFVMELEGLKYKEALEKLAVLASVTLPKYNQHQDQAKLTLENLCHDIYDQATRFYQHMLYLKQNNEALSYFKRRGLSDDIIQLYQLGYSPFDSSLLLKFLQKKFTLEEITKSGVMIAKNSKIYDQFYGRVIFPIHNSKGKPIAFGGRILVAGEPKYLNSHENPIFHKGDILYAFHIAQKYAYKSKEIFIVEGYMDVLSLANRSIYNVVAPLGTSLKITQIQTLWQIVEQPTICFDNDNAGRKATARIANEALTYIQPTNSLKFIKLKGGKDPDEVINTMGIEHLKQNLSDTISLADLLFEIESTSNNTTTPEAKADLKNRLISLANKIKHKQLSTEYKSHFYNLLFQLFNHNYQKKQSLLKNTVHSSDIKTLATKEKYNHLYIIFKLLLLYPTLLNEEAIYEELIKIELPSILLDKVRNYILDVYAGAANNLLSSHDTSISNDDLSLKALIKKILSLKQDVQDDISQNDARLSLMRAFHIHSLYIVQKQIKQTLDELLSTARPTVLERLSALKKYELQLKNELNII